jgi:ankyrin repeat protein
MGAAANTDRRGIAKIDGGRVEPEGLVLETVAAAVTLGADINAANDAGETALHSAASAGLNAVVRYLAERGADLNAKNRRGLTPLAVLTTAKDAAERQSTVDLLRSLGATE